MHTTETADVHAIQVDELHVVGGKYEADRLPLRNGNGQLTRQYRRLVARRGSLSQEPSQLPVPFGG